MIANVSRAAREKRGGFTSKRRRTCSWFAGFVRNWNPLATSSTRIPEESAGYFARRRASTSRTWARLRPPSSWRAFSTGIGSVDTRRRLSRIEAARGGSASGSGGSVSFSEAGRRSSSTLIGSPDACGSFGGSADAGGSLAVGGFGFGVSSIFGLPDGGHDADQPQRVRLVHANRLEADQLEDAQKKGYDLVPRLAMRDDVLEPDGAFVLQAVEEIGDGVGDRDPLDGELLGRIGRHPRQGVPEGRDEIRHRQLGDDELLARDLLPEEIADEDVPPQHRPLAQARRRLLEPLVLDQAPGQLLPHDLGYFLLLLVPVARQQRLRLDVDEGGGHHQELARDLEVQRLQHVEVGEVLLGDPGDGDVVDVELLLADQVQQDVEGPLEDVETQRDVADGARGGVSRVLGEIRLVVRSGQRLEPPPFFRPPPPARGGCRRPGSRAPKRRFPPPGGASRERGRGPSPSLRTSTSCTRCIRYPRCGSPRPPSRSSRRRRRSCGTRRRCRCRGSRGRSAAAAPGR